LGLLKYIEGVSQTALQSSLFEGDLVTLFRDRAVVLKDWSTGDNHYELNDLSARQTASWARTVLSGAVNTARRLIFGWQPTISVNGDDLIFKIVSKNRHI